MLKNKRSIIWFIILILCAYLGFKLLSTSSPGETREAVPVIRKVEAQAAVYDSYRVLIPGTGRLVAKDQLTIVAEVGGDVVQDSNFKEGQRFSKGDIIIDIDSREAALSLRARKSQFLRNLTQLLADYKLDFPEQYDAWNRYLSRFDYREPIQELPEPASKKEQYFLASRGIFSEYYTIRQQEVQLEKFKIRAPFDGVVVESNITGGDVVSQGQRLGRFIKTGLYELWVTIRLNSAPLVVPGLLAKITSSELPGEWQGTVYTINDALDPDTQLVSVGIRVANSGLREGMFVKAQIESRPISDVIKIDRNLLINNETAIYRIVNDRLKEDLVEVVYKSKSHAYIRGVDRGSLLLKQVLSGAFDGMAVQVN